jgi:uncharacterized HAD superfamily protein
MKWEEYLDKPIPFEIAKPRVISVDCDGTLTEESCWTEEDMRNATPKEDVIKKVNDLHLENFIVIHTARRHQFYEVTVDWLKRHGVKYHAIRMGKMPADLYLDDKCVNVKDFV